MSNKDLQHAIWDKYFKGKQAESDLCKAHYAYHAWYPNERDAHTFVGRIDTTTLDQPEYFYTERCNRCFRARTEIRWDDLPGHCENNLLDNDTTISEVIFNEEEKFLKLLNSASKIIPKVLISKFKGVLDAQALFYLQSTTGYPPDVVAAFVGQDLEALMPQFDSLMNEHRAKSSTFKLKG